MNDLENAIEKSSVIDMDLLKKSIEIRKATQGMRSDFYESKWGDLEKKIVDTVKQRFSDVSVYGKGGQRL